VNPDDYQITVYVYLETCTVGWWGPKPTWDDPLTPIAEDGTWETQIVSGGCDHQATRIVAYLIPKGYDPPDLGNAPSLPAELDQNSVARVETARSP
jgi:hypothetical protein